MAVQWNNDVVGVVPDAVVPHGPRRRGAGGATRRPCGRAVPPGGRRGDRPVLADSDRDEAVERGVDVDEYVAPVAAAREELRSAWRPLATGFAALTEDAVATW